MKEKITAGLLRNTSCMSGSEKNKDKQEAFKKVRTWVENNNNIFTLPSRLQEFNYELIPNSQKSINNII